MIIETKFRIGKFRYPVKLEYVTIPKVGDRIFIYFGYNKAIIEEVKAFEGHHYHGYDDENPRKVWSIANTERNRFQLDFLQEKNPYARYDAPLKEVTSNRPLYRHQLEMKAHGLTRHYCILACEMGTGKSLAAIEVAEDSGVPSHLIWYVGPNSGVVAVTRELQKWKAKIHPRMMTYDELVKVLREGNYEIPQFIIFDESSKIKTPTAQRSEAARYIADEIRKTYGENGYVIEMSGTPSPKTPVDWWHQCEVACPGYLREGSLGKFKMRLCLTEMRESSSGGAYPQILAWLDNENKCAKCGQFEAIGPHAFDPTQPAKAVHKFEKSKNEVYHLYRRMAGLVLVKFKKDCLDLPDKQYKLYRVKPTIETLQVAKTIKQTSQRVIEALTKLRELSDGFQYTKEVIGTDECPNCYGEKEVTIPVPKDNYDPNNPSPDMFTHELRPCTFCEGKGEVPKYARRTEAVHSPKDDLFLDFLEEHEDIGRFVVWGGFTGTVDKLVKICHNNGWATLRIDGRGYLGQNVDGSQISADELLDAMDLSHPNYKSMLEKYPKVCMVGHPQAGGMALTFTASPTAFFYSNPFDGTARMQAEDRIHRAGMDVNRGATIIDVIHLPTDQMVLENLQKKKDLQKLSMGDLDVAMTQEQGFEHGYIAA